MAKTTARKTTQRDVLRCVTYCRISHDPTGLEAGVDRQHVDTDRLASDHGWTIVERVVDNDRSASRYARRSREGWARVMELVEAGDVEALVAYDLDRLTRQPKELERLIDAAERGVQVLTATGALDLASAGGRMVARMLCNVAAHEADRVRDRMRAKLRHDAENGRPHWARRPFGYNRDGTIVESEAAWMQKMATWIVDEGVSATEVAVRLNDANVAQASGCPWQSAGVKLLVTSQRNVGVRMYNGERAGTATWPAIYTEEQHAKIVGALEVRSMGRKQPGRRSLLTGKVICGVCGNTMARTNARDAAQFRCNKLRDGGRSGCGQSINAAAVERFVTDMVLVRIGDVRAAQLRGDSPTDDIGALRADLDDLAAMVAAGTLTMAEWKVMREPLAKRLSAAEAGVVRNDASAALARVVGGATVAERWHELDVDLQRRILDLVLDHITVAAGRRGARIDLDRVNPIWMSESPPPAS